MAILAIIVSANISLLVLFLLLASAPGGLVFPWAMTGLIMIAFAVGLVASLKARAAGAMTRAALIGAAPAVFSMLILVFVLLLGY